MKNATLGKRFLAIITTDNLQGKFENLFRVMLIKECIDSNSCDMQNIFDENSEGDYDEINYKDDQNASFYTDQNINYSHSINEDIEIAENL